MDHLEQANHLLEDIAEVSGAASKLEIQEWHQTPDPLINADNKEELAQIRHRLMSIQSLIMNKPSSEEEDFQERKGGLLRFSPGRLKQFRKIEPNVELSPEISELRDRSLEIVDRMERLQKASFDPTAYQFDEESSKPYINSTFKM